MSTSSRGRIAAFVVLTYSLSAIFYVRIASTGKLRPLPVLGLMWSPAAAAVIVRLLTQRNLRGTGWKWGPTRWQILSYLLPPALGAVTYGFVWLAGIGSFSTAGLTAGREATVHLRLPVIIALLATLGFLQGVIFALGEEIGWRGFLVPELARVSSFTATAMISGAAWSVYHYPLILFADYNSGTPIWFALLAFTWQVIAGSFVSAWLRLRSGSLWTGVILHASHNVFIQEILDPLTMDTGRTKYVTTEFGVGLAIAYSILALYFWRRRDEVQEQKLTTGTRTVEPEPAQA